MTVTVVYDYNPDGTERPVWMLIDLSDYKVITPDKTLYVDIRRTNKEYVGTFTDDLCGCSVHLSDLLSGRCAHEIGINMLSLSNRYGNELNMIKRLIVQVTDVAEVMASSTAIFDY